MKCTPKSNKLNSKTTVKDKVKIKPEDKKVAKKPYSVRNKKNTDTDQKNSKIKKVSKIEENSNITVTRNVRHNEIKNVETVTAKSKNTIPAKEINQESDIRTIKVKNIEEKVDKSNITNFNTYLFHQGRNYEAYEILGSHIKTEGNKQGVQFATWAPNAKQVYVVGDFNNFTVQENYKLNKITGNGIWVGFFEGITSGQKYKYCIVNKNGEMGEFKSDPYGIQSELRPNNASIIYQPAEFKWNDEKWLEKRDKLNVLEQPINIYEIHLGSWRTNENGEFLSYEQISEILPQYLTEMNFTHVEIMPLVEHPLDASWGYQGTGYYSPTSRYGNIEGLKCLINRIHEAGIGVILDWVPGHFCKDSHGLYKFDGEAAYEYQEEWRAENAGWGTCNFDLGRPEVKSYLISNALYWFRNFHIDGLRVDAVSSILYLDYDKGYGQWVPNKYGGNGNLEGIEFLKQLNQAVFEEFPTALMIAEESTAWPNITKPPAHDGLGFNLKWNMGWMNDTLEYIKIDPKYRKYNHKNVTFSMMYNYAENYLLPLSHDEVVHGKQSLIDKMWGDEWNKFAGLRVFISYMMGHPGKKLFFMGCEFAQFIEWREYEQLEWNLIDEFDNHRKTQLFFKDLNKFYLENKSLWELDYDYRGFSWIEPNNAEQSILIFMRRSRGADEDTLIFINNFTSKVYYDYRIGVPFLGSYEEVLNTDDSKYGGSGQVIGELLIAERESYHNQPYSLKVKVPPMATLVLKPKDIQLLKEDDEEIQEDKDEEVLESKKQMEN